MFKEQAGDGHEAYDAIFALRDVLEVHAAFQKWLCANMALSSGNDFSASVGEDGRLTVQTVAGPVVADLELIQTADGARGRLVFYEPERKVVGIPARAVFAVRLGPNFEVFSGDADGHQWGSRQDHGWIRSEALKLGYEILLGQLKPRQ